jgi:hypothetical protein
MGDTGEIGDDGPTGPTGPTGSEDSRFGFFTGISTPSISTGVETELTWSTLTLSNSSDVSLSGGGRISLDTVGLYRIELDAAYEVTANNNRKSVRTRLRDGSGTPLPISSAFSYHRNITNGGGSSHISYVYNNTSAPSDIQVTATRVSGTGTIVPLVEGFRAIATRLT